jgi:uncharacterized protein (TIGR02996 family)
MKRRVELDGRFWEVAGDRELEIRWGAIGRRGQAITRKFELERDALVYAETEMAKQIARGYVEVPVVGQPQTAAAAAREPTVERCERVDWIEDGVECFREIVLDGKRVLERTGRVFGGRDEVGLGATTEQRFATFGEAYAAFDARVATLGVARPPVELRSEPELEAACVASPDDPAPWSVLADRLVEHGDPRGELAALHLAGKRAEAETFLRARCIDLVGRPLELAFRHGFIVGATLQIDRDDDIELDELTRQFLASPPARFIESLRFGLASFESDNDWAKTLRAVCESPRVAQIRALRFDAYSSEDCEISWTPYGDFSFAWPLLPALEHLHVRSGAGGTLGTIALPRLKTFIRESGGLARAEIEAIARATWPALEHLEIWFGSPDYGAEGTVADLHAILAGTGLPKLRHLGIVNCEFVPDAIPLLARSRVLPQLTSLDLSKGTMGERAADALVEHAAAFRHLAAIDVRDNFFSPEDLERIRDAVPNLIGYDQRWHEEYEEDGARYVAVGE